MVWKIARPWQAIFFYLTVIKEFSGRDFEESQHH